MCGIRVSLVLSVLLVNANARPDGYDVKGGRLHKSTANAVARSYASANAGVGAIARSFATATASANGGGTSNADASANASANEGNIGKVITSEETNRNANWPDDTDDHRLSSDSGHVGIYPHNGKPGQTGEVHGNCRCPPEGVKSHVGKKRCKDSETSVSNPFPTQHESIDLFPGSKHSGGIDSGYGGHTLGHKPGTIGGSHSANPCALGDSKCFANKPSISNTHPTYDESPDFLAGSSIPVAIDGGYRGNSPKIGTIDGGHTASSCATGDSKCLANRPSVSNPYPTHEKNPDSSAGSSIPVAIVGGYVENSPKPAIIDGGHAASSCAPGDSKCLANRPSVSSTHSTYGKNPDLSTGSSIPVAIDGGYGENSPKPGTISGGHTASPCAPGNSKCLANRPSVSNPHPTYGKNPDLSTGSSIPVAIDAGYRVDSRKPGTISGGHAASSCAPGDSKCLANRPSVSNTHPIYDKNPDLSIGSSIPVAIDGGYGENSPKPGTISGGHAASSCAPGDSKCLANRPSVSNTHPMYGKNPDLSIGSSIPVAIDGGYGENSPKPGTISGGHAASSCAPGDSKCLVNRPSVSNTHPMYGKNPDLSIGSSIPVAIDAGSGVDSRKPGTISGGHAASSCAPGDSKCLANRPSVSNTHPMYGKNPDLSIGSSIPVAIDGGYGENSPKPGTISGGHAASSCAPGDSKCLANRPSMSNTHPMYGKNPDLTTGSSIPVAIDAGYGVDSRKPGTISGGHAASSCAPGDSKCLANRPSVSNTHPMYGKNPDLSIGSSIPVAIDGGYGENSPKPGTISGGHAASSCAPGDSKCLANRPSVSNTHPMYGKNPDLSIGSSIPVAIDGGYGENSPKPGTISGGHAASSCAPGDSKCLANRPSVSNTHPMYGKNPDLSIGSSIPVAIDGGYGENSPKPGTISGGHAASSCAPGDSKCLANRPSVSNTHPMYNANPATWGSNSEYPTGLDGSYRGNTPTGTAYNTGKKPETSNPFLNGEIDVSSIKNPSNSGIGPGGKPYSLNPFLNPDQVRPTTGTHHPSNPSGSNGASVTVAPQYPQGGSSGDSRYPSDKQKPPNPFFAHHEIMDSSSGMKYPGGAVGPQQNGKLPNSGSNAFINNSPMTTCGSISCVSNKPFGGTSGSSSSTNHGSKIEDNRTPGSEHGSSQYPERHPSDSNPFLIGDQFTKPSKPKSHESSIPHGPSVIDPLPVQNEQEPEIIEGCGILSGGCDVDEGSDDDQSSPIEEWEKEMTTGTKDSGVKGHRGGVKGFHDGSHHHGFPIKLQGNSGFGDSGDFEYGHKESAGNTGNSEPSAWSNAMASSSSFGGVAKSSASAKSEASSYGSFASSSASATAFANSYSNSHHR